MKRSYKRQTGFTIVELLIVIVVIGILAAITIIAYNGVQSRAENSKTVAAVAAWAKALHAYNAELGSWPTSNSCLGASGTYDSSVYGGRCWPSSSSGWVVSAGFLSQVQPYIGNTYPEPSTKPVIDTSSGNEYRGAMFYRASATDIRIYAQFPGVTTCPMITGLGDSIGGATYSNGRSCYYRLAGP